MWVGELTLVHQRAVGAARVQATQVCQANASKAQQGLRVGAARCRE